LDGERDMASFRSNEDYFQAIVDFAARLDTAGHSEAAAELRDGLGAINGLTDGWALLLESIERVKATHASRLTAEERETLETMRAAAHSAVYR
jgi:hypothetical protein